MNKLSYSILLAITASLIAATAPSFADDDSRSVRKAKHPIADNDPRHGQYLVTYKGTAAIPDFFTGKKEVDVEGKTAEIAHRHGAIIKETWKHAVKGALIQMTAEEAADLAQDPDVIVEEDSIVEINTTQNGSTWGLDRIDQRTLPLSSTYSYDVNGSGVRVYVIDTGVLATHTELTGRVATGYTSINDGGGTNDCNGHGTHVSGTIAGTTYGVAKGATIVPVRVMNCAGSGTVSGIVSGLNWVTANRVLPAVANMSLGASSISTTLDNAVKQSIASGVTYVVAAGNSGVDACKSSPAKVTEAITVGATSSTDTRASWSNFGSCLDLFAPGVSITSAWHTGTTATNTKNGTSMAAPHVAGAAALYLAANPGSSPAQVASALSANSTPSVVVDAGANSPNKELYTGFITAPVVDTTPPTVGLTSPAASSTLNGTVTLSANATDNVAVSKVEFYANSTLLGTATASPYQLAWNSAGLVDGTYSFTAKVTDSAGLSTTSSSISATVSNAVARAAAPVSACSTASQLLLNPSFESGAVAWTSSATGLISNSTSYAAKTGTWKAKLAGTGTSRTDTVYQQVTLPSNACTATLSYWYNISTTETTAIAINDRLTISVVDPVTGNTLTTPQPTTLSNLSKTTGYVQGTMNLGSYLGKTIRIQFQGSENASRATTFLIDDVSVNITQ